MMPPGPPSTGASASYWPRGRSSGRPGPARTSLLPLIRRLGGTVWLDDPGRVHRFWLEGALITRGCLERLADYPHLKGLRAEKHIFTRDELAALSRLTSLESLLIEEAGLTDESIAPLAELRNLRKLDIGFEPDPRRRAGAAPWVGARTSRPGRVGPAANRAQGYARPSDWMSALAGFPRLRWLDVRDQYPDGGRTGLPKGTEWWRSSITSGDEWRQLLRKDDSPLSIFAGLKWPPLPQPGDKPGSRAEGIKHLGGLTNLERLNTPLPGPWVMPGFRTTGRIEEPGGS